MSELSPIPSLAPSSVPNAYSPFPSLLLSRTPSGLPSAVPSRMKTELPSAVPSRMPSRLPSAAPSRMPSGSPSAAPSRMPSSLPSAATSRMPSSLPSAAPTPFFVDFQSVGRSGKFNVLTRSTNVAIAIDSLYELDGYGVQVGNTGKNKHSLETFANQEFEIGDKIVGPYDGVDGPNAAMLPFRSPVSNIGTIEVLTYILKEEGSVTTDGSEYETWNVTAGDFKWSIKLSDWSFCGEEGVECKRGQTNEFGEKVDVTIEIKGRGTAEKVDANSYSLGDGVQVYLSELIKCDGEWKTMETGYPKYEVKGSKQLWTFRFPKFDSECLYDPLINTGSALINNSMNIDGERLDGEADENNDMMDISSAYGCYTRAVSFVLSCHLFISIVQRAF